MAIYSYQLARGQTRWMFTIDLPSTADGRRRQMNRKGFVSQDAALAAETEARKAYARADLVADVLEGWAPLAGEPAVVFEGGPVQPEAAICLARTRTGVRRITGFNRVSGSVGTVDLSGDPEKLREAVLSVRVFAGYAGWAAGQLEGEISSGSWFVFEALPGDAFVPRPDDLWSMVLRRQGGITAAVAIFPADPAMN